MATNPMQKKARNSFILGILITAIVMGFIIAFLVFQIMQMTEAEKQRKEKMRTVYSLISDVKSGDSVSGSLLQEVTVDRAAAPEDAISEASLDESSIAKIDLSAGTVLTAAMISDDENQTSDDLRVQEYNMIKLSTQLQSDDYIDIRLRMPSGLDYIVVSKKRVEIPLIDGASEYSPNTIWLKLTEDETLVMSSAIVEAYIMEGAMLYTASYVEPGMQATATPTYVPSNNVQYIIRNSPNIVQTAKSELLNRYTSGENQEIRGAIEREVSQYADDQLDNIEKGLSSEIQAAQQERQSYLDALAGY